MFLKRSIKNGLILLPLLLALSLLWAPCNPSASADGKLSLAGKRVGIAVVGTDHNWDRQAFQGAIDMVKQLGGKAIAANAERNDQKQVSDLENLLAQKLDAIVNILGNGEVLEPVFAKISKAGVPLFTVDAPSQYSLNNTMSDNYHIGSMLARTMAENMGGEGNVAVFNGFYGIRVCGIRYDELIAVLKDYPKIKIIEPELQDVIPNTIEDARRKITDLLQKYPKGELDAIWACWDIPNIGANQALEEAGRTDVKVYGIDGDPTVLEILADPKSSITANAAQQPYLIGQTSIQNVAKYLAGSSVPGSSFVPAFLVTKENVDKIRPILTGTPEERKAARAALEAAESAGPSTEGLSLKGKQVGIAVVGTDHNWDRQAFQGAIDMVKKMGGKPIAANAERNDQKQVSDLENLLAQKPDAIINILGNGKVLEPVFAKISKAGVPLFTIDAPSQHSLNNTMSDNYQIGSTLARTMAENMGGEGNVAVFNGFYGIRVCGIRYDQLQLVLKDYPKIKIIQPELQDVIPNTIEDARRKITDLLQKYPKGKLDAVWACWDIPNIGANQALEEAGRTDVKVYGIDGDPTVLEILADPKSSITANAAQQPYLIGQTSVVNIAKHLAGKSVPLSTFVPAYLVTKENAEEMIAKLGYDKSK